MASPSPTSSAPVLSVAPELLPKLNCTLGGVFGCEKLVTNQQILVACVSARERRFYRVQPTVHALLHNPAHLTNTLLATLLTLLRPVRCRLVFALCMGVISIFLFSVFRRLIPFYVLRQARCPHGSTGSDHHSVCAVPM